MRIETNQGPYTSFPIWRKIYRAFYILAVAFITCFVFLVFITVHGINGREEVMFGDMIYGTAYKPFVYRFLLPSLVKLIVALLPSSTRSVLVHSDLHFLNWETYLLPEYLVASILMCASLIGFCFSIKYLFRGVFQASPITIDSISLIALVGLPPFFKYYSYIYDFPTLFLFTLGLGLMVHRKWGAYLFVFILACLNKETAILLTLVFTIHYYKRWRLITRKQFFRLLLAQIIFFLFSRLSIVWVFRNNPGNSLEFHLFDHNIILIFLRYSLANLLLILGLVLLVFYKWDEKPVFLKNGLFILFPLLVATLFLGFLDELRDYYEVYPIVLLLISHTVAAILKIRIVSLPQNEIP